MGKSINLKVAVKAKAAKSPKPEPLARKAGRSRMRRDEREHAIITESARFFAEVGFDGDTRELARRLGVTQPLIFKYFDSKEVLIERVFRDVCLSRWNPNWESIIADRSKSLKQRMVELYNDYAKTILSYEWVRIFLFSRLRGQPQSLLYLKWIRERFHLPLLVEIRREFKLPSVESVPIHELEIELLRTLNEKIFYNGIRRWVYDMAVPDYIEDVVDAELEMFFSGAPSAMRRIIKK